MHAAKYLVLGALIATPVALLLAAGRGDEPRAAAENSHRAQWEYRVVPEVDLAQMSDLASLLSDSLEKANKGKPQRWQPGADGAAESKASSPEIQMQQIVMNAALAAMKDKESRLNDFGTQGWELVAIEDHTMIFRRSKN
jgi:hypothetical protein